MPEVEKTSLFGTAVHAVLESRPAPIAESLERALEARGHRGRSRSAPVTPSLEDVFLDVVERAERA